MGKTRKATRAQKPQYSRVSRYQEQLNNPDFNSVEFDGIRSLAGLNSYKICVREWDQFAPHWESP